MRRSGSTFFVLLTILLGCLTAAAQDKAPAWLTQVASTQVPTYDVKNVPAAQLLNDESVVLSPDGTIIRTVRRAVKILERNGREEALARTVYTTDTDKVKSFEGWLIRRTGTTKEYGKKDAVDVALQSNDLYNEARVRLISAEDDAEVGDVFGFESVLEEKSIFSQFHFGFQHDIPVLIARFSVTMPAGWKADGVTFNATAVQPVINGNSYSWEMRDLKPIRPEPQSPSFGSRVPRLAVSIFPDTSASTRLKPFASWNEVAKWMAAIEDPQMTVNDDLAAKAKDLTANAKTEFEKIQAISRYVQAIQYISIQIGTGRGGGYIPHSATDVFSRSYGDCKDKANLMRAMLSVLKIDAYMVSITADDPEYVRPEWPSPHQFNHCIIAVKISDATTAASVVTHPTLGRLLIFDATDPYTPLGDLPEDEQGSWALIDHAETNELIKMPVMPADMNRLERKVAVSLDTSGNISGSVTELSIGQPARRERARMKGLSSAEYKTVIDRWISRGAAGATTTKIDPKDSHLDGKFDLRVDFSANMYAQVMQQRLMVFKPAIIGRLDRLSFGDGTRMLPYMIDASFYTEESRIKIPQGFAVDEMPEPVKLEAEFGTYESKFTVEDGQVIFARSLKLQRHKVPVEKYDTVKNFFGRLHAAEQAPVVLIRQ